MYSCLSLLHHRRIHCFDVDVDDGVHAGAGNSEKGAFVVADSMDPKTDNSMDVGGGCSNYEDTHHLDGVGGNNLLLVLDVAEAMSGNLVEDNRG